MPRARKEEGEAISPRTRKSKASAASGVPAEIAAAPNQHDDAGAARSPDRAVTAAKPPVSAPAAPSLSVTETPYTAEEEIRRRAYELYEQDGRQEGRDREHWLHAETEVLGRNRSRSQKRA